MLLTCLLSPVAGFICSTLSATTDLVPTVTVVKYQIRRRMCTRAWVCGVRAEVYHWLLSQQEAQQLLCIPPDSTVGSIGLLGDLGKGEESPEAIGSQMDGVESHQQNISASTWQVLLSSMSQKRPAKQKQKLLLNRGGCFLDSKRN